jgi:hypothetical protein
MHRRAIVTNTKFVYANQRKKLRGLLRYFQYRNDKESAGHVRQFDEDGQRIERWTDCGLGNEYREILDNCLTLATDHLQRNVSAQLLVIAPEVHWMEAIPEERRADVLRELTQNTVEGWFERMNLPTPEYAYVCHESVPSDQRPDGSMKDEMHLSETYLHSHVVLPATVPGFEQEREGYKVYDRQIHALHEAGREVMEQIWERELGVEQVAQLNLELEQRTQHYLKLDATAERVLADTELAVPERDADSLDREIPGLPDAGLEMEFDE